MLHGFFFSLNLSESNYYTEFDPHILIESSNGSVIKFSLLENYIFLTNAILAQNTKTNSYRFLMFIPEMTCSLTVSNRLGRFH